MKMLHIVKSTIGGGGICLQHLGEKNDNEQNKNRTYMQASYRLQIC